jgi:hypothetical protein
VGEDTLIQDGTFSLPGKKVLKLATSEPSYIVVDVTESPIERPKKAAYHKNTDCGGARNEKALITDVPHRRYYQFQVEIMRLRNKSIIL